MDSRTLGATATATYKFSGNWEASAGLRADRTRFDYDNHMLDGNTDQNGVPCGAAGCLYARPADRSDSFNNLSPRATIAWNHPDHYLYLNASSGFRPPEMTELYRLQRQQSVADLDSERVDSWELGWKARDLLGSGFNFAVALFDMRKRNVILRESNGFNVGNGETSHRGLEYEITSRYFILPLREDILLTFTGTVARHEYGFSRAVEGGETIIKGNDIDTAPRNVHSIGVVYPGSTSFQVGVNWNYVGSYFLDAANTARYPGHDNLNLRVSWRTPWAFSLGLRVDNLLDTAYADRADFAFGNYRYFPARGRAAFLSVDYSRY